MVYIPADARATRPKTPQWVTPTLTGASNVGGGYQGARYCRINGIVYIQGWISVANATQTTIFTLIAGYRPGSNQALTVGKLAGGVYTSSGFEVRADGSVVYPAGLAAANALYLGGINFPQEL
jgi:hypothetical protein